MSLLATPFHARAVEANRDNAWENRRGYTLASHYSSVAEEAVAARFGAVLADLSWQWRVTFSGTNSEGFVARAFSRNGATLDCGMSLDVLWLNDAGAVRGRGTLMRLASDRFVLLSPQDDRDWLAFAATLFGVSCQDQSSDGMLALIGPTARSILRAAGLVAEPPRGGFVALNWRGLEITLCRLGLGFVLCCDSDSALIVWDRLMAAGRAFALLPAGQAALDILECESGLLRSGRDFVAARDGFGPQPSPQALGLCKLVDRAHIFNGKAGFLAAGRDTVLSGLLLSSPPASATLTFRGAALGKILSSWYSPALQQTVGFGILTGSWLPDEVEAGSLPCRVVALPFLPMALSPSHPDDATEGASSPV